MAKRDKTGSSTKGIPRAYEGRLELTWTNKHLRLLAHEDGSYEWVNPADYRVAEVRLLHDVAQVGDVGKMARSSAAQVCRSAKSEGWLGGDVRHLRLTGPRQALPSNWQVSVGEQAEDPEGSSDAVVTPVAPDGRKARLFVQIKSRPSWLELIPAPQARLREADIDS